MGHKASFVKQDLGCRHRRRRFERCCSFSQERPNILNARDQPVLNLLAPKPPPSRTFEAMALIGFALIGVNFPLSTFGLLKLHSSFRKLMVEIWLRAES